MCIFNKLIGLYYKHITIVNDDSRVIWMMLQVVATTTIVILTTLEVSFMLLENIYSTSVTYDCNLWSSKYFYSTEAVFLVVSDPSMNELWAT
jgi:hypothetical protein